MKVYGAKPKDCGNCGFSCNCGGKLSRKETAGRRSLAQLRRSALGRKGSAQ